MIFVYIAIGYFQYYWALRCRCLQREILPGVGIDEEAVVAAGAAVTKDIPPYTLFGAIPVLQIGVRNAGCPMSSMRKAVLRIYNTAHYGFR